MELEDLKQQWKRASGDHVNLAPFISDQARHKLGGPVEKLKRTFKRRLIIVPIIFFYIILRLWHEHDLFSTLLFWFYSFFGTLLMIYFYANLRMLGGMDSVDRPVVATLRKQVTFLEDTLRWRLVVFRSAFVLFPAILELLLYSYKGEKSLIHWRQHDLLVRISTYILFFCAFYLISRLLIRYKYQKPILQIKEILKQAE